MIYELDKSQNVPTSTSFLHPILGHTWNQLGEITYNLKSEKIVSNYTIRKRSFICCC